MNRVGGTREEGKVVKRGSGTRNMFRKCKKGAEKVNGNVIYARHLKQNREITARYTRAAPLFYFLPLTPPFFYIQIFFTFPFTQPCRRKRLKGLNNSGRVEFFKRISSRPDEIPRQQNFAGVMESRTRISDETFPGVFKILRFCLCSSFVRRGLVVSKRKRIN